MTAAKIAVSLPEETLRALDRTRKTKALTRSAAIAEAVREWASGAAPSSADRRYAQAYLEKPEHLAESAAVAEAVVAGWEPWE